MSKASELSKILRELADRASKKSAGFKSPRFKAAKNYWQGVERGYTVAIAMLSELEKENP